MAEPIQPHTNAGMPRPGGRWQSILNESWPQRDETGFHARDVRDNTEHTLVEARIVWKDDGQEVLPGVVTRRWGRFVFVEQLNDPRVRARGVWLEDSDTRPR
ncbi:MULTISPECIES: hypothetical protein [unclassified Aeromicrobium]|uniref:hypothetical protein n=1 Tax=unclassified Aeromicrobium TaxID=2633570 RepID=UPI002889CA58|nr:MULTISPECIES: hypothetical protein [unclassified Aeromicrobium]